MSHLRLRSAYASLGALALLVLLARSGAADTLVVPSSLAGTPANSLNTQPFGKSVSSNNPLRYQQVYASSEFPTPGQPLYVSELHFRIDESQGTAGPVTIEGIEVHLSTTAKAVDGLDTVTYDNNVGPDDTLVFNGTLDWDACGAGATPCIDSPRPFDLAIVLTTPFAYDPTAGNLLLEVFNHDDTPISDYYLDQELTAADPVSRVTEAVNPSNMQHVFTANSGGLVTEFVYTVPEPAAAGAGLVAILAVLGLRRARLS